MSIPHDRLLEAISQLTASRARESAARELANLVIDFLPASEAEVFELELRGDVQCARSVAVAGVRAAEFAADTVREEIMASEFPGLERCLSQRLPWRLGRDGGPYRYLFPLTHEGVNSGVLVLHLDRALDDAAVKLVRHLTGLYANHVSLLDYGQRDALTGLLNRKTFVRHFVGSRTKLVADQRAAVTAGERWLAVLDIDHFKKVNDRYGHLIGDEVLMGVSRTLRESIRSGDHVFRFGGEEFVILLENVAPDCAPIALNRIRERVAEQDFASVGQVTVSLGATRFSAAETPDGPIYRADAALYYAKDHGRNQVCVFEDLADEGLIANQPQTGTVEIFREAA